MDTTLTVCDAPTDAIRDAILAPLSQFNAENGYPADPRPVAITVTDKDGAIIGGLWGKTVYDWLFVEYLVVPAALRGRDLGSELLLRAEKIALDRGCVGSWLTTFTFQARGFYEKRGYEVFGALENAPRDNVRIFLRKRLRP
ncbi:GNAT family N-acetyltransferase [Novosphingobium naphthalenivorans]|uniref:GNAT family N-acetyltransferase n=1 Tax=Novosphingobium naphthalenivorans TaxID=273168 RepID=UPI0008308517|nr:GNAT family N-acetyltransferase [Novosphingobium naphthalenivorans]